MPYWWINTDHWFFLRKLWRKQYINVNCQVIYSERQPVFHIFLYFSYTGVWVPEGLDQALLLLLESGETNRGTRLRRRRRSWSGERASSSSTGPRAEAPEGSGLLLPAAQPGRSAATEEERAEAARPKCWAATSSLSRPGVGSSGPGVGGGAWSCRRSSWREGNSPL